MVSLFALAAPLALAQTSTWVSDPNHSEVDFAISHMSISKVHGRFGGVNATIQYNEVGRHKVSVQVTIDVSTVDTGVQARDTDLKGQLFRCGQLSQSHIYEHKRHEERQQFNRCRKPDASWSDQACGTGC